jgi:hypothetical protein
MGFITFPSLRTTPVSREFGTTLPHGRLRRI